MKNILTENMKRFRTKNLCEGFQGESMPKKEKTIKKDGEIIPYYSTTVKVVQIKNPDYTISKNTDMDDRRRIFYTQLNDVELGQGKFTKSDIHKFARGKGGSDGIPTMDEFQDILIPNRTKSIKMGYIWIRLASGQLSLESLDGQGGGAVIGMSGREVEVTANNIVLITSKLAVPMDGFDDNSNKSVYGGTVGI